MSDFLYDVSLLSHLSPAESSILIGLKVLISLTEALAIVLVASIDTAVKRSIVIVYRQCVHRTSQKKLFLFCLFFWGDISIAFWMESLVSVLFYS